MYFFLIVKTAITITILFLLKNHLSLIVQVFLPSLVKHSALFIPLDECDEDIDDKDIDGDRDPSNPLFVLCEDRYFLQNEGFKYIGAREEKIRFIMKNRFHVFFHPDGIYADVLVSHPENIYLISVIEDQMFLLTRNYGFSKIEKTHYISKNSGKYIENMVDSHKKSMSKHSMGNKWTLQGDIGERINLAVRWYKRFVKTEYLTYSILSLLLNIVGIGLLIRIWTF